MLLLYFPSFSLSCAPAKSYIYNLNLDLRRNMYEENIKNFKVTYFQLKKSY